MYIFFLIACMLSWTSFFFKVNHETEEIMRDNLLSRGAIKDGQRYIRHAILCYIIQWHDQLWLTWLHLLEYYWCQAGWHGSSEWYITMSNPDFACRSGWWHAIDTYHVALYGTIHHDMLYTYIIAWHTTCCSMTSGYICTWCPCWVAAHDYVWFKHYFVEQFPNSKYILY